MNTTKSLSNTIISSALRKGRGVALAACCMLMMGAAWSCSSDDDDSANGDTSTLVHSAFATAEAPDWSIDWTANDPAPEWQEPASSTYECSMSLLVTLDNLLVPTSTDDDQLAVFIDGTCRGVSRRNVYDDGSIVFLIYVKGASEEVGEAMSLRYYSGGAHQLFVSAGVPPFEPNNNISEEAFSLNLDPFVSSTKYPYYMEMGVSLPESLPFIVTDDDKMAIFVGNECRGVFRSNEEFYPRWRGSVILREKGEQAYIRYYSASKGGIYTFSDSFAITEKMQSVNLRF